MTCLLYASWRVWHVPTDATINLISQAAVAINEMARHNAKITLLSMNMVQGGETIWVSKFNSECEYFSQTDICVSASIQCTYYFWSRHNDNGQCGRTKYVHHEKCTQSINENSALISHHKPLTLLPHVQVFGSPCQSDCLACSQCESWRFQYEHFYLAMGCKCAFQIWCT